MTYKLKQYFNVRKTVTTHRNYAMMQSKRGKTVNATMDRDGTIHYIIVYSVM